jgi:hypothetical protein
MLKFQQVAAHGGTCLHSRAEAGGLRVQGQLELHFKTPVSSKTKQNKKFQQVADHSVLNYTST